MWLVHIHVPLTYVYFGCNLHDYFADERFQPELTLYTVSGCHINPFRTKPPNMYSQEDINLYCIIMAT